MPRAAVPIGTIASHLVQHIPVASERFRFRFIARGEQACGLVVIAARSLRRCHPDAAIVVVDANDAPAMDAEALGPGVDLLHVPPGDDAVALAVGRGSRRHLYYWRHSRQLLAALPPDDRYDVHADADLLFVRPLDLGSLLGPLARGRIAAAVDESFLEYYDEVQRQPAVGTAGPLLQGGLLFANPADDGGLYERFWKLAVDAARAGRLAALPWDDMCLLTALLGHGAPLWERLLTLAPEWNYIADARKDPGALGCVAHCGGRTAQAEALRQRDRLLSETQAWGTSGTPPLRGPQEPGAVHTPFALTWPAPPDARACEISAEPAGATLLVFVDGRLVRRLLPSDEISTTIRFPKAETVTVVGLGGTPARAARLEEPSFTSQQGVVA